MLLNKLICETSVRRIFYYIILFIYFFFYHFLKATRDRARERCSEGTWRRTVRCGACAFLFIYLKIIFSLMSLIYARDRRNQIGKTARNRARERLRKGGERRAQRGGVECVRLPEWARARERIRRQIG